MPPAISHIIFWPTLAIIIVIIFVAGIFLSKQSIDIAGCKAEWNNLQETKQSSACPQNQTCKIDPYVEQHNAITSALLCACDKARSGADYPNKDVNKRIEDVYAQNYGSQLTVREICESGDLVKLRY
ncbi:MAG: hypothetical protein HY831_04225 [Candidatus Aenigmarchaeota archaeon]|nr:hypothetical protein [Candidatus Aenigmarchaeota archaeon]